MSKKKTLKKIQKMKQNDEITVAMKNETIDIICIGKEQYLVFTPDSFYEMNYDELIGKYC